MTDLLAEICAKKREHVGARQALLPLRELKAGLADIAPPRDFAAALQSVPARDGGLPDPRLICEIKKASPSHGLIRADFDVAQLAADYAAGGAACLSVLTDQPYFQGDDSYIAIAKTACNLPVLRKDFMIDPYQIWESRRIGADCILLIMAALGDNLAKELEDIALSLRMAVLIEVHDEAELKRALTHLRSPLIGINNRNLKTLEIDLNTALTLSQQVPPTRHVIAESGIRSREDITQYQSAKIHCFLVGHWLMLQRNICNATQTLRGVPLQGEMPTKAKQNE